LATTITKTTTTLATTITKTTTTLATTITKTTTTLATTNHEDHDDSGHDESRRSRPTLATTIT
jgi:hypothetical protein